MMQLIKIFLTILLLLSFESCCAQNTNNNIQVIDFVTKLDLNFKRGQPNYVDYFRIKIVSHEDLNAFIIGIQRGFFTRELQTNTGEVTNSKPKFDTLYTYNIIKNGMKYGLKFDSLSDTTAEKFDVEAFYERINIGKQNRTNFAVDGDSLTYSLHDKETGKILIEKYFQQKRDLPDSIYRYYDAKMKDINFSISPFLDERSKSKLVKISLITNSKINNGEQMNKEEFTLSISRGAYDNMQAIMKLFTTFKAESEKLKLE